MGIRRALEQSPEPFHAGCHLGLGQFFCLGFTLALLKVQDQANGDSEAFAGLFQPVLLVFVEWPETTKFQYRHHRSVMYKRVDKQTAG